MLPELRRNGGLAVYQPTPGDNQCDMDITEAMESAGSLSLEEMRNARGSVTTCHGRSSAMLIASLLSHDIRHHLSVVYCNAEFLSAASVLEADRKQLFEEVKVAITDATRMLDFILFHSKGDLPLQDTVGSFSDLIAGAVSAIRPHPHAEGVNIIIGEFPRMCGRFNQTLVSSAVYNLLLNACFAAQQSGRPGNVEITLRLDRHFVSILVKDNGIGLSAEIRQGLPKPFVTCGKRNGTGLGTTIADYVAREYGGHLELECSSPGCTIFALRFAMAVFPVMEQP